MAEGTSYDTHDCYGEIHPLTLAIAAKQKGRACLHCGATFLSEGVHNRICNDCKVDLQMRPQDEDPFEFHARPVVRGRVESGPALRAMQVEGARLSGAGWDLSEDEFPSDGDED